MNFKQFLTEDRAVSPVIGVILMVAITVILAAVIGSFVLGLGDSLSTTAPSVSFDEEQGTQTVTADDAGAQDPVSATSMTIVAQGGDTVNFSHLDVTAAGAQALRAEDTDGNGFDNAIYAFSEPRTLSAGTSVTIIGYDSAISNNTDITSSSGSFSNISPLSSGDTVTVTWTSSDGSSSSVLYESEVN